ncbi:MAG TPA: 3-oxoacyl-ACP reductase FabG [Rhabdochlamydiaceae bacterium]|jgi:3-oxoacyl-[acyl-carrier protein] reductase|nr:3-oxoacyl-ACP reductase FabG [Rhabdochlamydiaceae bacterium]
MLHHLKDKAAVITGGTAGIGKEIALAFAKEGAHVAIFGTNAERAKEVLEHLKQTYPNQKFLIKLADVSDKKAVDQALQEILAEFGKIDILVNNAGITRDGLLMKMAEDDWDRVIAVNLKSVYNTCQALVRPMLKARCGKIINITSVVGLNGNAGQTNYAASKAGMIGFTQSLAKEVASRGICVNCIAPGFIKTPMTDVLTEEQKAGILKQVPMNRLGNAEEIASAAVFLASDGSNYITGQVLTVDGGMVM